MNHPSKAGFRELEHTADWKLDVWAEDLPGLFLKAAEGLYDISGIKIDMKQPRGFNINLLESDRETLLVSFLSELLYLIELENLAFQSIRIHIEDNQLTASLTGGEIIARRKEIKAVTFHGIKIKEANTGYRVQIVFDV